jgi:hypothetical protein
MPRWNSKHRHEFWIGLALVLLSAAFILPNSVAPQYSSGSISRQSGVRPAEGCDSESVINTTVSGFHHTFSPSQAAANSNASALYASEVHSLGPNVTEMYTGVGAYASINKATCSPTYGYYLVSYALNFTNASNNASQYESGELSITVSPATGAVHNASVTRLPNAMARYGGAWSAYAISKCSDCSVWLSYTQITNFGVSASSGNCGATWYWNGYCTASFWGGITNQVNGGNGIVQSGIDGNVLCAFSWWSWSYNCNSGYAMWFEFYPAWPVYAPWWMSVSVSSSNAMIFENYVSGGWYYSINYDASTGWFFWGFASAYMNPINYGQFQAENQNKPFGGTYATPNFNFWYNPIIVYNDPADLRPYGISYASWVTPSAINYNSGACSGAYDSCFQL